MPANSHQPVLWLATWGLCILVFMLILWRPRRIPEFVWATGGAALLVICRLISPERAGSAVREGTNVYMFLAGMMLMSELARQHGVFDWLAAHALEKARGSQLRLFVLVYGLGVVVTALLSNDATAVLLTPAVLAVVRRAKTAPLPCLFACAFVANAASFVLPISNPANLVVFRDLPRLGQWMHIFLLPAMAAILVTFGLLWVQNRNELRQPMAEGIQPEPLDAFGKRAGIGVLLATAALLVTSALGGPVGPATLTAGLAVALFVAGWNWRVIAQALRQISWGVLPLVAGLFVIVEALKGVGALTLSVEGLKRAAALPGISGMTVVSFSMALAANAMNNLPMGLIGAAAVRAAHASQRIHAAVLLGINLGPNLSVTGSLATILWLMALRREGIAMSGWQFLRAGLWIMPCALIAAVAMLALTTR